MLTFVSGDNYLLHYIHCLLNVTRPRSNAAPSKNLFVSLAESRQASRVLGQRSLAQIHLTLLNKGNYFRGVVNQVLNLPNEGG